ncbi:hypothetical protein CRI94_06750 [Longibacter salinarum]|uniref:DUF4412 domain-containing protein n=1 Tax=Longibacter salinarum TaxID=1850348 RepID=A0A2A8CYP4_9BACT|nr:DUF6263 family protein [Longibacter salinarum]PEN13766.1 hypothetical protein CRI94_06750 [Longibacter salinarum]
MTFLSRFRTLGVLTIVLTLFAVAGCSSSSAPAWKQGDAYILGLRVNEGESFSGTMAMDQSVDMQMMGQNMQMEQSMTYDYGYDVISRSDDGLITIEQTLQRVRGETKNPMAGTQTFDTDNEEDAAQIGEQMTAMIDVPIRFTMTEKGQIERVEGVDALVKRMQDQAMTDAQREILEESLTPESFTQNMQAFTFYPQNPVAVGDSWDVKSEMKMAFPMTTESTYTVTRVEADTAYLDVEMDVYTPDDAEPMEMGGGKMTMDMTGTMIGTAKVDLVSGMMTDVALDQNMEADAVIDAQGRTMDMQMSITGTSTQTLTGLGEPK